MQCCTVFGEMPQDREQHLCWLHWVMRHKYDGFYMCHVAQGGHGKYSAVLLREIPQDRPAFTLASLGDATQV